MFTEQTPIRDFLRVLREISVHQKSLSGCLCTSLGFGSGLCTGHSNTGTSLTYQKFLMIFAVGIFRIIIALKFPMDQIFYNSISSSVNERTVPDQFNSVFLNIAPDL